jgi:hypothetical protein
MQETMPEAIMYTIPYCHMLQNDLPNGDQMREVTYLSRIAGIGVVRSKQAMPAAVSVLQSGCL